MAIETLSSGVEKIHPPFVHLTYDFIVGNAIEVRELPFVIGILADLNGQPRTALPGIRDRQFVEITADSFDTVLGNMRPRVAFSVDNKLNGDPYAGNVEIDLEFWTLEDFGPEQVARRVGLLRDLLELRDRLAEDKPIQAARIDDIDRRVSLQLEAILHHPRFQRLEATWRGIRYLVGKIRAGDPVVVKVFNASKEELLTDMQQAPDFIKSGLFLKIYDGTFHKFGGEPFGCLVGDYEFGDTGSDIEFLERISLFAASAHAPFLAAASAGMIGLPDFAELDSAPNLARTFSEPEHARWNGFRQFEHSRFVCLTLPRVLLRAPYAKEGLGESDFLWGSGAYALAGRLAVAFAKFRWCAAIRGRENGRVDDLPACASRDGGPVETLITDRREMEMLSLGFTPLLHNKSEGGATFFSVPTCHQPEKHLDDASNLTSSVAVQLAYVLAVSRFAHYLKCMMRDRIGSFMSRQDCEDFLNRWLARYVAPDDNVSMEARAQRPLREGHVEVREEKGKPGVYLAIAHLRPHFQLDPPPTMLKVVALLPTPAY